MLFNGADFFLLILQIYCPHVRIWYVSTFASMMYESNLARLHVDPLNQHSSGIDGEIYSMLLFGRALTSVAQDATSLVF